MNGDDDLHLLKGKYAAMKTKFSGIATYFEINSVHNNLRRFNPNRKQADSRIKTGQQPSINRISHHRINDRLRRFDARFGVVEEVAEADGDIRVCD